MTASYNLSLLGSNYNQGGSGAVARTTASKLQEVVSVLDFGADPTGVADSTAAIQAAIDWVIYKNLSYNYLNSAGSVHIPGGIYKTTDTIQCGYGETFHSILVYGDGKRYRCESGFSGTGIVPTFSDRPVFAVSGGRYTTIRGLSIKGLNYNWITSHNLGAYAAPTLNDLIASNWVDPSFAAAASSQYAPYCAIAIDPYAGIAPATAYPNVTFPSWSGITTQYGKAFSSCTVMEDVEISGFVVGIANQPCNSDGNGDFTKMVRVNIECCQYGISIGNTQSRLVHLQDGWIDQCHTGIVTGINGKKLGKPQVLVESCELSSIIYWMNIPDMPYGTGMAFKNCYGEVIYSLGTCTSAGAGLGPIVFDNCEFSFTSWDYRGIPASIFSYSNGGIDFRSCAFSSTVVATSVAVNFYMIDAAPENLSIDNCLVISGAAATKYYEKYGINATAGIVVARGFTNLAKFSVHNTYAFNLNTGASVGQRSVNQTATLSNRQTCFHIYAKQVQCAEPYTNDGGFPFKSSPFAIDKTLITTISTSVKTVTVNLTGAIGGTYQLQQQGGDVGDVVYDDETQTTFVVSSRTGSTITLIAQTNLDVSGNLLVAPTKTGNFWCINCRMYTPFYVTYGDLSTASATISNVARPDGYNAYLTSADNGVQIGDFVFGGSGSAINKVSPGAANITNVTAGTIVTPTVATYTATRQRMDLFVRASPANGT